MPRPAFIMRSFQSFFSFSVLHSTLPNAATIATDLSMPPSDLDSGSLSGLGASLTTVKPYVSATWLTCFDVVTLHQPCTSRRRPEWSIVATWVV